MLKAALHTHSGAYYLLELPTSFSAPRVMIKEDNELICERFRHARTPQVWEEGSPICLTQGLAKPAPEIFLSLPSLHP